MTTARPTVPTLAGYRVVRQLGSGSRGDVFLGVGRTGSVALKVFNADVPTVSISRELSALGRVQLPHFVRLLDVETAEDSRPVIVLERVSGGSAAALIRDRDSLEKGEVVTLLAPIADGLTSLHRSGVAHGRIGVPNLHIGGSGEPVLLGFGNATLFDRDGSIAAIDADPAAAADRNAMAALAIALLARVREAATDTAVVSLIDWIESTSREFEFCERLEARLFDLADPIPLDIERNASTVSRVPPRFGQPEQQSAEPMAAPDPPQAHGQHSISAASSWLATALQDNPIDLARARVIAFAKGVRKPFWFASGGVAIAFIVALSVLPQGSKATLSTPVAEPTIVASAPPSVSVPSDPLAAVPVLLAQRTRCLRDRSVACLDGVDDESSSGLAADTALVQELQAGGETPAGATVSAGAPFLIETLGDSALVGLGANSNPASVLLVRNEAGWRIRSYLSGVQSTGSPQQSG